MVQLTNIKVDLQPQAVDAVGGGHYFLSRPHREYLSLPEVFTADEIQAIISIGEKFRSEKGRTSNNAGEDIRKCTVSFLYPNELTGWIFEKITKVVHDANQVWAFELHGLFQGLQFTKYVAPDSHYTWHADMGASVPSRKLSLTVQLTDPSEYEGGDLEFFLGEKPTKAPKTLGSVNVFPSWTVHRVTPVTRGTRYSLVAWVSGPPFK